MDDCQGLVTILAARELLLDGDSLSDEEVRDVIERYTTIADALMALRTRSLEERTENNDD